MQSTREERASRPPYVHSSSAPRQAASAFIERKTDADRRATASASILAVTYSLLPLRRRIRNVIVRRDYICGILESLSLSSLHTIGIVYIVFTEDSGFSIYVRTKISRKACVIRGYQSHSESTRKGERRNVSCT